MSESESPEQLLQPYSVDQLAGAVVLCLGAVGSLLLVIWQSRCLCRCRIGLSDSCYIFDCSREPPPPEEKEKKDKKDKDLEKGKKEKPIQKKSPLTPETSQEALTRTDSEAASIGSASPVVSAEPEPEPEVSSSLP